MLLSVEVVMLVVFAVFALVKVYAGNAPGRLAAPVAVVAVARPG